MAKRKSGRDISGIIVINKPLGLTSNAVLQRVKKLFDANKAGHTGALDPEASGVLPICIGESTKFSQVLLESDKGYSTTGTLGEIRSTGDKEGEVLETRPIPLLSSDIIESVLCDFRGPVVQVPPMFSALKMNGRPLYELARKGMSQEEMRVIAEKKRRTIQIHDLSLESFTETTFDLNVLCSKGTYIRILVEDIGEALDSGAYVSRLHRTHSGPYTSDLMYTLDELELIAEQGFDALDALLLPTETAIPPDWPFVELDADETWRIQCGKPINTGLSDAASVQLWTVESGARMLVGIGRIANGVLRAKRLMQTDL